MIDQATPNESPISRDEMFAAARALIERGYQVILLYGTTTDGICECSWGPQRKSPGKHARERRWVQRPIRTVEALTARWERADGRPNIGVMPDDSLIVIDVDGKKGKRSAETLAALAAEHGPLSEPQLTTPSGGWHLVFRLPSGTDPATLPNRSGVAEGIDILRLGRQFVAVPSQIGMLRYTGSLPPRDELAILPAAWVAFLQSLGGDGHSEHAPRDAAARDARLAMLKAPSIEKVREVVACIPNPGPTDRNKYMWMAYAIMGACGREATVEGLDIWMDWAGKWEGPVDPVADERAFVTIPRENVHTGWTDLWRLAHATDTMRPPSVWPTHRQSMRPCHQPTARTPGPRRWPPLRSPCTKSSSRCESTSSQSPNPFGATRSVTRRSMSVHTREREQLKQV